MSSSALHEQIVEVKVRDPASIEYHRIRVVVDLGDLARRYGSRATFVPSGRCRFLEGAVLIEHLCREDSP